MPCIYTVAKQVGAMYVSLRGKVDAIILTGGIAHSDYCVGALREQIDYLAPVVLIPGEDEMGSLAFNAFGGIERRAAFAGVSPAIIHSFQLSSIPFSSHPQNGDVSKLPFLSKWGVC